MSAEEVPAICEKCLGSNPYLKMIKEPLGAQCRLCTRVFTVFRWNVSKGSKFSKTVICLTCARQRNCCQACMLDLTYGIPLHLRDAAFKMAGVENIHEVAYSSNDVTKRYMAQKADQKYIEQEQQQQLNGADVRLLTENGEGESLKSNSDEARQKVEEILRKLSQSHHSAQNKFNSKKLNSGQQQSRQGASSTYSPEALQNVDISKILSKLPFNGNLTIPKDESITSFFIFGINDEITDNMVAEYIQQKLIDHLNTDKKKINVKSIVLNHRAKCGYVSLEKRKYAEVLSKIVDKPRGFKGPGIIFIRNVPIRITWGKVKSLGTSNLEQAKLGTVVRKQVKLLAAKDKQGKGKSGTGRPQDGEEGGKTVNVFKPAPPPGKNTKPNYSSLKSNFEL